MAQSYIGNCSSCGKRNVRVTSIFDEVQVCDACLDRDYSSVKIVKNIGMLVASNFIKQMTDGIFVMIAGRALIQNKRQFALTLYKAQTVKKLLTIDKDAALIHYE